MIPFTGFLPDVDPATQGVITSCVNSIPTVRGMKASPSLINSTLPALSAACLGAAIVYKLDGTTRLIAGTSTKLYEGASSSWSDVSKAGNYTAGDIKWRFAQMGDTTLATNKNDTLQYSSSGAFASIATAPKASVMDAAAGFIMLGATNDGTYGDQSDRWWCSAYQDYSSWTPSVTTQATTGRLVDAPGAIRGIKALGPNFVAYKDRAIFMGTYVGAPAVFQWVMVPGEIGCFSHEAVVSINTAHFFIGESDIYTFDGSRATPIGQGIKQWFFANLNASYRHLIAGMHEKKFSRVWWFFPKGTSTTLNAAIVYNYAVGKWGYVEYDIECPVEYVSGGITFDGLGALFSTYNDFPNVAFDSPFWTASTNLPAVIDTTHTLKTITGISGGQTITTGIVGDDTGRSLVSRVKPRFTQSPSSATVTNFYSDTDGVTMTQDATSTMSESRFDFLRSARWHQLEYTFSGDNEVIGHTFTIQPDGLE